LRLGDNVLPNAHSKRVGSGLIPAGIKEDATMSEIASLDQDLNQMIAQGQALEAFEKFYAEDCVMQENLEPERKGKDQNREYEKQFFASVEQVHDFTLLSEGVGDDVSFSEWRFDVSFKDGNRMQRTQVARRQWKDGKVVHERFYYAGA
jgi:ketosteroid isomerase-like protein